jgi:hypothetical protein
MSAAPEPIEPRRLERALERIQADCELMDRMTAVDDGRPSVQDRLEQEIGRELTTILLIGLTASP